MKTKEFKVGDRIFDIRYGWGTVVEVFHGTTAHPMLYTQTLRFMRTMIANQYLDVTH